MEHFFINPEWREPITTIIESIGDAVSRLETYVEQGQDPLFVRYHAALNALVSDGLALIKEPPPPVAIKAPTRKNHANYRVYLTADEWRAAEWVKETLQSGSSRFSDVHLTKYDDNLVMREKQYDKVIEGFEYALTLIPTKRPARRAILTAVLNKIKALGNGTAEVSVEVQAPEAPLPPAAPPVINPNLAAIVGDLFANPEADLERSYAVMNNTTNTDLFHGYSFFKDADVNGDPRDIFKWILNEDPTTCSPQMFIRGLLKSRVYKDNGKTGSLVQDQIVELCVRRNFSGWSNNPKVIKETVKRMIADLKSAESFDAASIKRDAQNYPTLATYKQDHFDRIMACHATNLEGDDLDAIFENLKVKPQDTTPKPFNKVSEARKRLGLI